MQSLTDILTVLIGLVFVYLILSILTSYMVEIFATWLEKRQQFLANAIQLMLNPTTGQMASVRQITQAASATVDFWAPLPAGKPAHPAMAAAADTGASAAAKPNFLERAFDRLKSVFSPPQAAAVPPALYNSENAPVRYFFSHPAIGALSRPEKLPSYITSEAFTSVILDLLHRYGIDSAANAIPDEIKQRLPESLHSLTLDDLRQMLPVDFQKISFTQLKLMPPDELHRILPVLLQDLNPEDIYRLATTDYVSLLENGLSCLDGDNPALTAALRPFFTQARLIQNNTEARLQAITSGITSWYNSTMDRATGWYKRYTQRIALAISLVIALAINADSVQIFQSLWSDAGLRQTVSSVAVQYVIAHPNTGLGNTAVAGAATGQDGSQAEAAVPTIPDVVREVQTLTSAIPVPIGWNNFPARDEKGNLKDPLWSSILLKLIGVLVTTLAISQGSSIWFQLLSKLINLRNAGLKPGENTITEASATAKG